MSSTGSFVYTSGVIWTLHFVENDVYLDAPFVKLFDRSSAGRLQPTY